MKIISVVFLLLTVLSSGARVSQDIYTDLTTRDLIVIPVRFSDVTNTTTLEFLENRIFVEMNNYYQEVSFDRTKVTGNILEHWVNIPRNLSYYGNYSNNNHSLGARKLIEDAIRMVDNTTDFSAYGFIMVVHAGDDEALSRNGTDIWSWGWWVGLGLTTNDGVAFQQGAVVSEEDPLGIFCHEFGHILELPDLYSYNENGITDFVGPWGVMGKGNWNDNGTHPSHPASWSKIKLGWIDPSQIVIVNDRDTVVRVEALEQSTSGIMVVKIPIISPDVYYLVEVRRRILYDRYLPSEGVLVTLINETRASGQGIVRVMDAMNWSTSLDDAAFEVEPGGNAVFLDANNNLGIVMLKETGLSFDIHITSYLKGKIAKEAHNALSLAEKQIDVLKDSKFEFMFIPLATIDLTLASDTLREAEKKYESQEYIQALSKANKAITEALASELRLRYGEINFYFWLTTFILVILGGIIVLFWRGRSKNDNNLKIGQVEFREC